MIICYLVTFSILKQRPFQNRLMKLTNLIMHWLFTDFTIIICYLVTFFNSKTTPFLNRLMKLTNLRNLGESTAVRNTYTCWCVYSGYSVCTQCTHSGMCAAARGPRARHVRQYCLDTPCRIPVRCGTGTDSSKFCHACMHESSRARAAAARARTKSITWIFRMHFIDERTMHDHRWSKFGRFGFGHACWGSLLDHQYWSDRRLPHLYGFRTHSRKIDLESYIVLANSFSGWLWPLQGIYKNGWPSQYIEILQLYYTL